MKRAIPSNHLLASPELFPFTIDFDKQRMMFVRMSREAFKGSAFLDHRSLRASPQLFPISFDDLFAMHSEGFKDQGFTCNLISHNAFSCSTLLTRYLEMLPNCLVLREPQIMTQLALSEMFVPSTQDREKAQLLLLTSLQLLSRTYENGGYVITKLNDHCNRLLWRMLGSGSRVKVVLLRVGIKSFVLSVLKSEVRRQWLRKRVKLAIQDINSLSLRYPFELSHLSDAQAGALVWHSNDAWFQRLLSGYSRERILAVDAEEVAARPTDTVCDVARHFDLGVQCEAAARLLGNRKIRQHSKDQSIHFDDKSRGEELERLEIEFGAEASLGIEWADRYLGGFAFSGSDF